MVNNEKVYIQLFIFVLLFITNTFSIEINVRKDDDFEYLINKVNSLSNCNEIILIFNDDYYKIPANGNNSFDIKNKIIFYSENGTIFDFQKSQNSYISFLFKYQSINKNDLKFQNITFYNFHSDLNDDVSHMLFFNILYDKNEYQISFDNCIFKDINGLIFNFLHSCTVVTQTTPQAFFKNCKFM